MVLEKILYKVKIDKIYGNYIKSFVIDKISINSKDINEKTVFVAIKGNNSDGHDFIEETLKYNYSVIVCEKIPKNINSNALYLQVICTRTALGQICKNFYQNPSSKLFLVGITGTNGKTTTAHLSYNIFKKLGYKTGLISTIHNIIDDDIMESNLTTPDIITINQLLSKMVKKNCKYCFMEVSSHSITQKRIEGLNFAGGVFLNITQDHLDYHKTFKNYIYAKKKFFDDLKIPSFALYNEDDRNGKIMIQNTRAYKYSFSIQNSGNFNAKVIYNSLNPLEIKIMKQHVYTQFYGEFNVYNILAAYSIAVLLKQKQQEILLAISKIKPPKGRFETFLTKTESLAIIDYAHTPDAIKKILKYLIKGKNYNSKIITVLGCGGNRDKSKRSLMGKIVYNLSDISIFTSDNPRNEDPNIIIDEMLEDIIDRSKVLTIVDRKKALFEAYNLSKKGDIILIAGKGHENYQIIKNKKYFFDDLEIIKSINLEA